MGPPFWDRFAHWPKWPARLVLALALALCVAAIMSPIHSRIRHNPKPRTDGKIVRVLRAPSSPYRHGDADLALYDRIIVRIQNGEPYYGFIVDEQRRSHYPVRPGLAVRLPTLAYIEAGLANAFGDAGRIVLAALLAAAVLFTWWRRLGEEPGGGGWRRLAAMGLLIWLGNRAVWPYWLVMHELWAGLLIALAIGLHRPGKRWVGALIAAGLALSIRELALPFVLLMGALAFWRRDWKEAGAWTALFALFAAAMAWHFALVAPHVLPTDRPSASWLALRGLPGWLSNAVLATNLRFIDHDVSAVLVVLSMLGWAGWRSDLGRLCFLFFGGYAVLFTIAGRWENFYWGWLIAPALVVGLAFVPRALLSLTQQAFPSEAWLRRAPPLPGWVALWLPLRLRERWGKTG